MWKIKSAADRAESKPLKKAIRSSRSTPLQVLLSPLAAFFMETHLTGSPVHFIFLHLLEFFSDITACLYAFYADKFASLLSLHPHI